MSAPRALPLAGFDKVDSRRFPARPFRLARSVLSVPAIAPALFPKALASKADVVMLDCEDSVAPADKAAARANCIAALNAFDWRAGRKTIMVRMNALDTPFAYRDVVDIVEAAGERLDCIMLPKAGSAADIYFVDCLLTQIEQAMGYRGTIGLEALIETARGAMHVNQIAAASPRLEALHFGAGDFAADCGAMTVSIGGGGDDYPGLPFLAVMQSIVIACRAHGLRPIDSAYGNFNDQDGYLAALKRAAMLGFEGKWAIHPSQIQPANTAMSPPAEQVKKARRIVQSLADAATQGRAAVNLDGEMVDLASVRMAQQIVAKDEAIQRHRSG